MDEVINSLEAQLSQLAGQWRSTRSSGDEVRELSVRRAYHETLRDLWDRGWRGEGMYIDMELPDEFMPDYYLEYCQQQAEQQWEKKRRDFKEGRPPSPIPLELPGIVGDGHAVDAPPLRALVLPVEVYSTGALVRVRIQHTELPDDVLDHPDRVMLAFAGAGDNRACVILGKGFSTFTMTLAGGRAAGPGRWDLEFWLPRRAWRQVATARLSWRVAGLDLPLGLSTDQLEAAQASRRTDDPVE